ncbi:FkbM family methyltransferase [Ochrobactrum sp. A-1]|uniref:FkbM family methyltransferase n=1 Tax=Ochrobactrum sp. A-1 TaxID=2920940 RepID=UPI001F0B3B0E|nr:FkbM family methyltransferase [Ochrobactrum sp. A-1]
MAHHINNEKNILTSVQGRYGKINFLINDDPIGYSLQNYGEWGQVELDKILTLMRFGDHVIDVGANVGSYTLAFSRKVGETGKVIAFEAQNYLAKILEKSLLDNDVNNVLLVEMAVSDKEEVLYFKEPDYDAHINAGAVSLTSVKATNMRQVSCVRLDDMQVTRCDLIKIDVEGMSDKVLDGAIEIIENFRPIIVLEVNDISEGLAISSKLSSLNYEQWLIVSSAFNPNNLMRNMNNPFGHAAEMAIIAVHSTRVGELELDKLGTKIYSADQLAELILQCPRYGDHTPYDRNINILRSLLDKANVELAKLQDETLRLHYRMALLEQRAAAFEAENINMEAAQRRDVNEVIAQLNRVYQSKSWKLTAPLRTFNRALARK